MKKLIAISVVFALVAGVAFAVDLSGQVIGSVDLIKADSSSGTVTAGAEMKRFRIEGGAEVADGKFGGWLRTEDGADHFQFFGYAWWKPIDQLKLGIGKFSDGIWGKEGNSGWSFYQTAADTHVTFAGDNVWGGSNWAPINVGITTRDAFATDFGEGLFLEITPVEMVGINIGIPFFKSGVGGDIDKIFMSTYAQVALNMSFGTIAFTFMGDYDARPVIGTGIKASKVYAYFGLTAIENLSIDFGLGAAFNDEKPLNFGIALKYGRDTWGIKFRTMLGIPILGKQKLGLLVDILPYFVINESFRAYISGGFAIQNAKDLDGGMVSWHVNPYIEVGEEWGPKFLAGIKVWQKLGPAGSDGDNKVYFQIPIALHVSF